MNFLEAKISLELEKKHPEIFTRVENRANRGASSI
jgi:hypothetical protein